MHKIPAAMRDSLLTMLAGLNGAWQNDLVLKGWMDGGKRRDQSTKKRVKSEEAERIEAVTAFLTLQTDLARD